MANKIVLKKSSVAAKVPVAGDLDFGELAINYTDGKLYFKKADNTIDAFTTAAASAPVTSVGGNIGDITDAQLLASIKNVDGTGSGLDADTLDGNHASAFYLASNPNGYTSNTGTVTSVGATAPLVSSGGTDPSISIPAANSTTNGYMTSAYAAKLDGIAAGATANTGTVTSVSGTGTVSGLTLTGTVTGSGSLTLGGTLSLTSGQVTTALGYTPYNSSNPNGYITSSGSITGSSGSVSGLTLTSSANGINPDNVTQNQLGYNTSVSLFGQTDGGLYSSAYNSSWIHQIYGDFRTGQIAIRGKNSGTWQAWRTVLDSSNYTGYAVRQDYNTSLNSDTRNTRGVTRLYRRDDNSDYSVQTYWTGSYWRLYGYNGDSGHADTHVGYADSAGSASTSSQVTINYNNDSNSTYQMLWGSGNSVYGTAGIYCNPATDYLYATSFYCSGWFRSSGNSGWYNESYSVGIYATEAGNVRTYNGANFIAAGNVTAYSDERLKENWRDLPIDFVEKLSKIKHGIYDRIDTKFAKTQVGVSAQSLEKILPYAIIKDSEGYLSVNYGSAAMVSAVKLAEKVIEQEKRIEQLESLVNQLMQKLA